MITIKLKHRLSSEQEMWLTKNVGPRIFYLHNKVGGIGWLATETSGNPKNSRIWELRFENDSHATWFSIIFSE